MKRHYNTPAPSLTKRQEQAILHRLRQGLSSPAIAETLGLPVTAVRRTALRHGVRFSTSKSAPDSLSKHYNTICDLYAQGVGPTAIAKRLRVAESQIRSFTSYWRKFTADPRLTITRQPDPEQPTIDQHQQLIDLIQQNVSDRDIAATLGIRESTLKRWRQLLRQAGKPLPRRGGRGRPPPSPRNQRILKLAQQGKSLDELAGRYGVSRQRIQQILGREGFSIREHRLQQPTLSTAQDKRARRLYEQGEPIAGIIRKLGLPKSRVQRWLDEQIEAGHLKERGRLRPLPPWHREFLAAYKRGASGRELAEQFGFPRDREAFAFIALLRRRGLLTMDYRERINRVYLQAVAEDWTREKLVRKSGSVWHYCRERLVKLYPDHENWPPILTYTDIEREVLGHRRCKRWDSLVERCSVNRLRVATAVRHLVALGHAFSDEILDKAAALEPARQRRKRAQGKRRKK